MLKFDKLQTKNYCSRHWNNAAFNGLKLTLWYEGDGHGESIRQWVHVEWPGVSWRQTCVSRTDVEVDLQEVMPDETLVLSIQEPNDVPFTYFNVGICR